MLGLCSRITNRLWFLLRSASQVSKVNVRSEVLAAHGPLGLPIDVDAELSTKRLLGTDGLAKVALCCATRATEFRALYLIQCVQECE